MLLPDDEVSNDRGSDQPWEGKNIWNGVDIFVGRERGEEAWRQERAPAGKRGCQQGLALRKKRPGFFQGFWKVEHTCPVYEKRLKKGMWPQHARKMTLTQCDECLRKQQQRKSRNKPASAVRHNSLDFAILRPLWPSYTSHGSQLKSRSCNLSIPYMPASLLPHSRLFCVPSHSSIPSCSVHMMWTGGSSSCPGLRHVCEANKRSAW